MFRIIAASVVILVAAILAYAAFQPDAFRIQREISIKAPPDKIFPLINDLHRWRSWSPYERHDPAMKRAYSGPQSGKGAIYEWDGNSKVGIGRMEILNTTPPSKVVIKLDFIKPCTGHNTAEFTMTPNTPDRDTTNVAWAVFGPNTYFTKLMHVFINVDKIVGKDFEEGLANFKTVAER